MGEHKGLASALLEAQRKVQAIGKASRNAQQGYDYTSAETLIGVCSTALNNAGVIVRRVNYSVGEWGEQVLHGRDGESRQLVAQVSMVFRVTHAESGEHEDYAAGYPAVQQPGRPADKAVSGALTASMGYFLRDLLAVARGHDAYDIDARPEPSAEDAHGSNGRQRPQQMATQNGGRPVVASTPMHARDDFAAWCRAEGVDVNLAAEFVGARFREHIADMTPERLAKAREWMAGEGRAQFTAWALTRKPELTADELRTVLEARGIDCGAVREWVCAGNNPDPFGADFDASERARLAKGLHPKGDARQAFDAWVASASEAA